MRLEETEIYYKKYSKPTASESWYAGMGNNPVNKVDLDGQRAFLLIWATNEKSWGHAGIAVANYITEKFKVKENGKWVEKERQIEDGTFTYYDLWPGGDGAGFTNWYKDIPASYNKPIIVSQKAILEKDVSLNEKTLADGVIELNTSPDDDAIAKDLLLQYRYINKFYNGKSNNCSDYVKSGVEWYAGKAINAEEKIDDDLSITTPNMLFKATANLPIAKIIKDPKEKVQRNFVELKGETLLKIGTYKK